jgi:hypothetical protein
MPAIASTAGTLIYDEITMLVCLKLRKMTSTSLGVTDLLVTIGSWVAIAARLPPIASTTPPPTSSRVRVWTP